MISLAITIDLEWCPLPVAHWLQERFAEAGIHATIFATDTPHLDWGPHEVALHPNPFRPGSEGMAAEARRLKTLYPQAIGLRMHRLAWESGLEQPLAQAGIRYVSTHMLPKRLVTPFRLSPHLVHFPIFYMDHHELVNVGDFHPSYSLAGLSVDQPGLYVFDFHPNLLFTNAPTEAFYRERVHPYYQDADRLASLRHAGRGCFDLFREVVALRGRPGVRFLTLAEAHAEFTAGRSRTEPPAS
jgi:hypothetical protein